MLRDWWLWLLLIVGLVLVPWFWGYWEAIAGAVAKAEALDRAAIRLNEALK